MTVMVNTTALPTTETAPKGKSRITTALMKKVVLPYTKKLAQIYVLYFKH